MRFYFWDSMTTPTLTQVSSFCFVPSKQGKVRDIFDLGSELLIVATDRLSAFDVVLPDGISNKGKVLTQISAFWFKKLHTIVSNHLISTGIDDFPDPYRSAREVFAGRSMLVKKTKPVPVECVVRGYISGSAWNDYKKTQSICGIKLPDGLRESDRLPEPIFTPSTKADLGAHDENISFDDVTAIVGKETSETIRDVALALYREGSAYAETRGIIIADTKFEFGLDEKKDIVWIDEALTPDSSRFWPKELYQPGGPQPSFDKQFVRDYLLSIKWDRTPPGPRLPTEVLRTTSMKYEEALRLLTGQNVQ
jgi:phosphoribosylaminoimidazole-succinocarboxamide synthase